MTTPANLGAVEVDVELNVNSVDDQLRRSVRRPAERIGEKLEQQWARSGASAGRAYSRAFNEHTRNVGPTGTGTQLDRQWATSGDRAGTTYANSFSRAFTRRLRGNRTLSSQGLEGAFGASLAAPLRGLTTLAGALTAVTLAGSGLLAVTAPLVTAVAGLGTIAAQSAASVSLLPAVLSSLIGYASALVVGFEGMYDALSAALSTDPKALTNALERLTPAAREAVRAFHALRPQLAAIRRESQESMFEGLDDDVSRLGDKLLPELERGLSRVSSGVNKQIGFLLRGLTHPGNVEDFGHILDQTGVAAERAAPGLRAFLDAYTDISAVGADFLPRMADGFTSLNKKFARWAKQSRDSGELRKSMEESLETLKQVGRSLRDFGGGIANMFRAAQRASGDFSDSLEGVAERFHHWTESTDGRATLDTFFEGIDKAADAVTPVLKALGRVLATTVVPILADVAHRTGPAFENFILGLGTALEFAEPGISALADGVAALLRALDTETMEGFGEFLGAIGEQVGRVLDEFGPDLANGLREILPSLKDLAEGFGDLLVALSPLLPILGDVVAFFAGTFGDALSAIAALIKPLASAFSGLNESMGGLPATLAAAAVGFVALRKVLKKFSLSRQLKESTKGTGKILSDAIERETKNAERTAEKSGRKIGNKLKKGMAAVAGTAAVAGLGTALLDGAEDEIEAGQSQLGDVLGGALKLAALAAGPWGAGAFLANELLKGFTDFDFIGGIGDVLSRAFNGAKEAVSNFLEHGFTHDGLAINDDVTDIAGGLFGIDTSNLDEVDQKLLDLAENSKHLRSHLDGLFNGVEQADPEGLKIVKGYLSAISGDAESARRNLGDLIAQAATGDASAISSLRDALRDIAEATAEGKNGIEGLIEALISGADKLPGEVGGLFNFRDLGESAAEAKPPIDELNGALKEFSENSKGAGENSGLLNEYLGGVAGASFEAQANVHGLSNALLEYQTASSSTAQTTMWLQTVLGLTAGVFGSSMSMMVQSALMGWTAIGNSATAGMNTFASTVQGGMSRSRDVFVTGLDNMNTANRSAWGAMRDSTSTGSNNVVGVVGDLATRIVSAVSGMWQPMYAAGINAMSGLAAGIRVGSGAAEIAAAQAAQRAVDAAKSVMVIMSPSRVFHQIGVYAGEGLARGLLASRNRVAQAAADMSRAAITPVDTGLPPLGGGGTQASRRPAVSHNRNVTNHWNVTTAAQDPRAVAAALRARYDYAAAGVM